MTTPEWRARYEQARGHRGFRRNKRGVWVLELVEGDRVILAPAAGGVFASAEEVEEFARRLSGALPKAVVESAATETDLRKADDDAFRRRQDLDRRLQERERELLDRLDRVGGENEVIERELDKVQGARHLGLEPDWDTEVESWEPLEEETDDPPEEPPVWVVNRGDRPGAMIRWGWRRVLSTHGMVHVDDVTELIETLRRIGPSIRIGPRV